VESLPITLHFFTNDSSIIYHSSATICLPISPTISCSPFFHSFFHFTPLPISLHNSWNNPLHVTDCFRSSLNDFSSFQKYMPSPFPANALFLLIDVFSSQFWLCGPFSVHSFLLETTNLVLLYCWALSLLVALPVTRCVNFLSWWLSGTVEILQCAVAKVAVVQLWCLHLHPAALAKLLPRHTPTLTASFFLLYVLISPIHLLLLVSRLGFAAYWDRLHPDPGRYTHQDRICEYIPAHQNIYRVLTLTVDTVCNLVLCVHSEVGKPLACTEVDALHEWHISWQSSSLGIRARSVCSSVKFWLWRHLS